jgi:hypothetical protein
MVRDEKKGAEQLDQMVQDATKPVSNPPVLVTQADVNRVESALNSVCRDPRNGNKPSDF